jgi:putative SOS response-associated peptidase YedK
VIVTDANEVVEKMHDRMPVIIQEKDYDRQLTADPTVHLSIRCDPSMPTKRPHGRSIASPMKSEIERMLSP